MNGLLCSGNVRRNNPNAPSVSISHRLWKKAAQPARLLIVTALAMLLLGSVPTAYAIVVTDNFDDGNDTVNPTWTRMDGTLNNTGRVWDASSGQYYLRANNDSTNPGVEGYGFVGSYVGPSFRNVRVVADFVDVTEAQLENPTPIYFGVAARLHGVNDLNSDGDTLDPDEVNAQPTPENGLSLRGYMYVYEPFQGFPNPAGGEMVLYIFHGGGDSDVRSQKVRLDYTKDYRFVLEVVGSTLHGQVYNLTDGGILVAETFRNLDVEPQNVNHDGNPATPSIPHVPYVEGYSGVIGVGSAIASSYFQFTIDNFLTESLAAGDYNRNGTADAADYVLWRRTLGQTGPNGNPPTSFGDMRANGAVTPGYTQVIDGADYNFWKANFGTSVSGSGSGATSSTSVPEPVSGIMALVGLIGFYCSRPRYA